MFDEQLYLQEMTAMVDDAIRRMKLENPEFKIYTISIWTDPNAAASSINFDNKENSLRHVEQSNEWSNSYYVKYLEENNFEQAELFKPNDGSRMCNPADFVLRDFNVTTHKSFPQNWETKTEGKCWEALEPALIEVGNYTFSKINNFNMEDGFELSINSQIDWYDKTWP